MPYAEVVVNSPISRISAASQGRVGYHYHVPPDFQVEVGHLLLVPFGPRVMQGVVVALLDDSDVEGVKDVITTVDPLPILSPAQVQLARWIAEHYCCSLAEAVQLSLPPGIQQRSLATIEARPEAFATGGYTEKQIELLAYLRRNGKVRVDKARSALGLPSLSSVVTQLLRRGAVNKAWELERPRVRPRVEKRVRARPGQPDVLLAELDRAPRQRAALEYLLAQGVGAAGEGRAGVPLEEFYAETGCTPGVLKALLARGIVEIAEVQVWRDPLANRAFAAVAGPKLTPEQQEVWESIERSLQHEPQPRVFLLHGITGSGKTEIYVRALEETLRRGQQALVLVPEIALTPQTVHRFAAHFPGRIAVWHSRLTPGERYDEWRRVREGYLDIVIGSRSAVFAPLWKPGIIIVDEEHEWSYKNEKTPRYHARDVAIRLAELTGAKVILGSATPDVVTYRRAETGRYTLLELRERVEGLGTPNSGSVPGTVPKSHVGPHPTPGRTETSAPTSNRDTTDVVQMGLLPPVHVVDMRQELRAGNRGIFSRALHEGITLALSLHEQVILFLNRRGTSTFVMCRDCGYVLTCRRCNVPMVYHGTEDDLVCHQCNYRTFAPNGCPNCWGHRIRFFGIGTQKVEEEVKKAFPSARVLRWDSDAIKGPLGYEQILDRFRGHEADILVGTQMIAKGLDLPLVTLVGVISADTILHLPDFRAGERTFQLLTQVAGRAGRGRLGGRVVVQTYSPEHYCIQAASRHDYFGFYRQETEFRQRNGYPPFGQLAKLVYQHTNDSRAQQEAERMAGELRQTIDRLGLVGTDIIGPAPSYIRRLRGRYRWQVIIRGNQNSELIAEAPISFGWTIDIDPLTTL